MKPVSPFRFPLAFDPLRLLLALRDHGIALILLTALGLAGGGALGYKLFKKNTYSVTSILRKTKDAEGFSLFGTDGYKPALLKDQALEGIAMGHSVLTKLGEQFDPPETVEQLEKRLNVRYDTQQKLFYLEAKAPTEKLAIGIANRWSDLVAEHSKELMRAFASKDAQTLTEDLKRLDEKIIPINKRISELSEEEAIIDDDAAYATLSGEIQALRKELRNYEIQESTFHLRYMQTIEALIENHPLKTQMQTQRDRLNALLAEGQTEESPHVEKLRATIATLSRQAEQQLGTELTAEQIRSMSSVGSAQLHFERYLSLKEEQFQYEEGIRMVKEELVKRETQMKDLPLVASKFRELDDERARLLANQSAFDTQLTQAMTYAGPDSKGYLEPLEPANYGMAELSTGKYKTVATGLFLTGLIFVTVLLWAFLRELRRPELRTMLQGAITTRATPTLGLLQKDEIEDEAAVREFWLSHVAKKEAGGRRILFPIVGELKSEFRFWKTLLHSIKQDNALVLFIDVAQDPVPESFLKANLLPFSPSSNVGPTASTFLQGGGTGSADLWKVGTSFQEGGDSVISSSASTSLMEPPMSSSALSTNLMPNDQPIIPHASDVSQSALYVSAADYSAEKLARLLQDLPPHYHVICRWAIGPTSSLAAISKDFDQHFLLNSPMTTQKKVASSQSRIFRRILGTPSGILFLNEPVKGIFTNLIHQIENRYFDWRLNKSPKQRPQDSNSDDNDL